MSIFALAPLVVLAAASLTTSLQDEAPAPEVEVPEAEVPEAEVPEAEVPEAEASDGDVPEADVPEAAVLDAEASEAEEPGAEDATDPDDVAGETTDTPETEGAEAAVTDPDLSEAEAPPAAPAAEDKQKWAGDIQFNVSSATGNTENTVLGGQLTLARSFGLYTNNFEAGGNYARTTTENADGSENTETTQNNWFLQYRGEYQVGDRSFIFGRLRYEQDEFSGFDSRTNISAGLGHTFIKTEQTELTILTGPGFQYSELATPDPVTDDFEDTQSSASFFFGENFTTVLRDNVTLTQSLDATIAEDNTTISNIVSINTDLTDRISSRVSYQVKHETDPPDGRKNTDTLLTASLGYTF
ncbi:MAG: DUF481 domain-containing protein [Pseudomonadota bacterium]